MQLRWQKIYQERRHTNKSAFSVFTFDSQAKVLDWSFGEMGVNSKVIAALETAICWHLDAKKSLFDLDLRELENYLREHNHEALLSNPEIQELQENLENMKATCVNNVIQYFFKETYKDLPLVQKTLLAQDFLGFVRKMFLLHSDELRLIDIRKEVVFLQVQNSSFGVFLEEFSKKVDLFVSFVAHQGNLS